MPVNAIKNSLASAAVACLSISPVAWGSEISGNAADEPAQEVPQDNPQANLADCVSDSYALTSAGGVSGGLSYTVDVRYSPSCQLKFGRIKQVGFGTYHYEIKLQQQNPFNGLWYDLSNTYNYGFYSNVVYSYKVYSSNPVAVLLRACGRPMDGSNWVCTYKA